MGPSALLEFQLMLLAEQLLDLAASDLVKPGHPVLRHVDVQLIDKREILLCGAESKAIETHALAQLSDDFHPLLLTIESMADRV